MWLLSVSQVMFFSQSGQINVVLMQLTLQPTTGRLSHKRDKERSRTLGIENRGGRYPHRSAAGSGLWTFYIPRFPSFVFFSPSIPPPLSSWYNRTLRLASSFSHKETSAWQSCGEGRGWAWLPGNGVRGLKRLSASSRMPRPLVLSRRTSTCLEGFFLHLEMFPRRSLTPVAHWSPCTHRLLCPVHLFQRSAAAGQCP